MAQRWTRRPDGSNWGEFGPDDQLGRANLLTPEKVLQGVAEVREGLSFCLSLPLNLPGGNKLFPFRRPPELQPTELDGVKRFLFEKRTDDPALTDIVNDDRVTLWTQYSTQWDSLSHVGQLFDADGDGVAEPRFYNGFRAGEAVRGAEAGGPHQGALALSIEPMAVKGMQGRGVLVDLAARFGRERHPVGYDDLMRAMEADGVAVEPGDMLCLHTGFDEVIMEMAGEVDEARLHGSCCGLNGRDDRLLQWITDSGIVAICADNFAVEHYPAEPAEAESYPILPLHNHCLFRLGVHLGELWHFAELARYCRSAGRWRFLLTAPPLRLPHSVGGPTTPIATV